MSKLKRKKKETKQGVKTVPVSEVLHVKPKRHRGFNTVPEEKQGERKPQEKLKDDKGEETTEGTQTTEDKGWDSPKGTESPQTKENKGWDSLKEKKGWDSPKENKGWDSKENKGWDNKESSNWDRSGSRKQPRNNPRRTRIDLESPQQFPSLSGDIVTPQAPKPWRPPGQQV